MTEEHDQALIASLLASTPPSEVSPDFVSRVNARIDETAGWFGLADFRAWTLRLAPAAAALALLAVLWPVPATTTKSPVAQPSSFSPSSATDWQQDVTADALLDAALHPAPGGGRVR